MKYLSLLTALLVVILPSLALSQTPVVSVPAVDLARYSGKWFEIASFPMFFQRKCIADATAEYGPGSNGALTVLNRCRTDSGFDEANGSATVVEGFGNSRLKVSFFWPFKGDYWVLGLDPEYRWAVVGNPNRKYLWVLSRTPQLSAPLLTAALVSAQAQSFDLTQLHYTVQSAAKDAAH